MITLTDITVTRGGQTVVDRVSATAKAGEFIALVGPNGSGKSSLLRALTGSLPHGGTTSLPMSRRERAKALAYLAQDADAPPLRRVREIVALGRTPHIGRLQSLRQADMTRIGVCLAQCGLRDLAERPFGTLSGGEQTRVHLARTLATDAPLLLADEPVTALDPFYQLSIMTVLREAADQGVTVIAALHDLALAQRFCDRIWVMKAGQLVADAPAKSALTAEVLRDVFRITPQGDIADS